VSSYDYFGIGIQDAFGFEISLIEETRAAVYSPLPPTTSAYI